MSRLERTREEGEREKRKQEKEERVGEHEGGKRGESTRLKDHIREFSRDRKEQDREENPRA